MTEIPRWKVDAALRLLGLDPEKALGKFTEVSITEDAINWNEGFASITDTAEDTRLHLLAILPGENWSELVTVDEDELKYFTGPKLTTGSLVKYPNGTLMLTVKRRPE